MSYVEKIWKNGFLSGQKNNKYDINYEWKESRIPDRIGNLINTYMVEIEKLSNEYDELEHLAKNYSSVCDNSDATKELMTKMDVLMQVVCELKKIQKK